MARTLSVMRTTQEQAADDLGHRARSEKEHSLSADGTLEACGR